MSLRLQVQTGNLWLVKFSLLAAPGVACLVNILKAASPCSERYDMPVNLPDDLLLLCG